MSPKGLVIGFTLYIFIFGGGCGHLAQRGLLDSEGEGALCERSRRLPSMGSVLELTLSLPCKRGSTDALLVKIQSDLDEIESELSLYQPMSPLSRLNREGKIENKYFHLETLIQLSRDAYKKTDGFFNVSILPVLTQIHKSFQELGVPPHESNLLALKPLLKLDEVEVTAEQIYYRVKGMALSFDGIAKGYAVDRVAHFLEKQSISNYLVNFSGNMRWRGTRSDRTPWKIGIWNPVHRIIHLIPAGESGALASSGPEINHYSKNMKWHHLINPRTLRPASYWIQTTIIGDTAMICDVLSTTSFVMTESQIKNTIQANYPNQKIWIINQEGLPRLL